MEKEMDMSIFDKNVMEMFDLCKDILKADERRQLKALSKGSPFLNHLNKYINIYSKTEPTEHVEYFQKVYTENKRHILLGPQREGWLSESDIVIGYGQHLNVKTEAKVHLSAIYKKACKMRDEIKEEIEGLPETSSNVELEYPSRFLLFLYHIFHEITESEVEKSKLATHIETLENNTGIRSNKGDDFSNLFDMAAGMVEQVSGSKIPRDKMPGKTDITKMFGDMMNDPKTKNMIGDVMKSFQNADGINDIATKVVGFLGNPSGSGSSDKKEVEETKSIESGNSNVNDEFANF